MARKLFRNQTNHFVFNYFYKNRNQMNKVSISITLALILSIFNISAQKTTDNCDMENFTFSAGERLSYVVSYNWFVVFSEVGLVDFTIKEDKFQGQQVYQYKAAGRTFKWWDKIFKVRDSYETWVVKETLRPVYFQRNTREGDFRQHENYTFQGDSIVFRKNKVKDNPFSYDTISVPPCTVDVMSAILHTRNIDYSNFKPNDKIPISVVLDEKTYSLYFRYLGIEDKKVKGVGTFECLKFTVLLVEGTLFHEGEDMFLWVTNDKNHIPVIAESPILIGSIKARITNIEGNRYPLTSKK